MLLTPSNVLAAEAISSSLKFRAEEAARFPILNPVNLVAVYKVGEAPVDPVFRDTLLHVNIKRFLSSNFANRNADTTTLVCYSSLRFSIVVMASLILRRATQCWQQRIHPKFPKLSHCS